MGVSLTKGGNVSLTKEAPGLEAVVVALGWNPRVTDGAKFDLDASVFVLGENGKVLGDSAFIFYNNKTSEDGAIQHNGDNRTGEGDGDDESINIDLTKLTPAAKRLAFTVTIDEAEARKQNFGQVDGAYIRVLNKADGTEIARFDLSEDSATETAMVFGELYRHNDEFKFKAIGSGFAGGLKPLAESYGVDVA